jgi:hypothetical protein
MLLTTWADVVGALDGVLAFASSLGLNEEVACSRFTAFRHRLGELADVLSTAGHEAAFASTRWRKKPRCRASTSVSWRPVNPTRQ